MIKADEFEVYDVKDDDVFRCLEDHVDAVLKKERGVAVVDMAEALPGRSCAPIKLRHWAEIATRVAPSRRHRQRVLMR